MHGVLVLALYAACKRRGGEKEEGEGKGAYRHHADFATRRLLLLDIDISINGCRDFSVKS